MSVDFVAHMEDVLDLYAEPYRTVREVLRRRLLASSSSANFV